MFDHSNLTLDGIKLAFLRGRIDLFAALLSEANSILSSKILLFFFILKNILTLFCYTMNKIVSLKR